MAKDDYKGTKVAPNIFQLSGGRYRVRAQIKDPSSRTPLDTYRIVEANGSIKVAKAAQEELRRELSNRIALGGIEAPSKILFRTFCQTRIDRRKDAGEIRSPATLKKLTAQLDPVLQRWGNKFLDSITRDAVEGWYAELCRIARGELYRGRKYSAHTVRGWWAAFRAVTAAAAETFRIYDPAPNKKIPLCALTSYTPEDPNSLALDGGAQSECARFFRACAEVAPTFYARFALEILTARRPCETRPIHRRGPHADINWATGVIKIRWSQTIGEPIEGTKASKDGVIMSYTIGLPPALVALLEDHAASLTGPGAAGDLLFPSIEGRWQHDKAVAEVLPVICKAAGITKRLTPYFARRTYHDLIRLCPGIPDLVVKSMGGHPLRAIPGAPSGETLAYLYSTVSPAEQAKWIAAMAEIGGVFLATGRTARVSAIREAAEVADLKVAA